MEFGGRHFGFLVLELKVSHKHVCEQSLRTFKVKQQGIVEGGATYAVLGGSVHKLGAGWPQDN